MLLFVYEGSYLVFILFSFYMKCIFQAVSYMRWWLRNILIYEIHIFSSCRKIRSIAWFEWVREKKKTFARTSLFLYKKWGGNRTYFFFMYFLFFFIKKFEKIRELLNSVFYNNVQSETRNYNMLWFTYVWTYERTS